jgi:hypothetical protein
LQLRVAGDAASHARFDVPPQALHVVVGELTHQFGRYADDQRSIRKGLALGDESAWD